MKKSLLGICFFLGLVLVPGAVVRADFQSFLVEQQRAQEELIWQSTSEHYQETFERKPPQRTDNGWFRKFWAIVVFILIVWILLWLIRRVYWEWKDLDTPSAVLDGAHQFANPETLSIQRLIQEGKAALKHDPMYATSKFQAALDHPLSALQKREVHHYLGIAYLERFRKDNDIVDEDESDKSVSTYRNPYLLQESQVHLLEARRIGEGNEFFQLDNNSWLISLYIFLKDYQEALDIAYEALNLAQNNKEEEKQEYLLHKINTLKKRIEKEKSLKRNTVYPKELKVDTVEVVDNLS